MGLFVRLSLHVFSKSGVEHGVELLKRGNSGTLLSTTTVARVKHEARAIIMVLQLYEEKNSVIWGNNTLKGVLEMRTCI